MDVHPDIPLGEAPYSLRERLLAITLVAVMLAGAWQALAAWRNPESWTDVPRTWHDFSDGKTTLKIEKQMDAHLPARERIIAFANSLRWMLLRGGGKDVVVGRGGWLFLTEEIQYDPPKQDPLAARIDLLAHARRALEAQGVQLLVALVPDKARVYPGQLPWGRYPAYNRSRYADGLAGLRARGVPVVDLLPVLAADAQARPTYYRTDTHWNTRGAALAAQAIARQVLANGTCEPATRYATHVGKVEARPGDLLRMMGLEHVPNAFRPAPDREAPATTEATTAADAGGLGLFGDASVPVVLTGTSFSMRGNFHGALQQALSCQVLNSAQDGGGFLTATGQYLKDDAFRTSKPKTLIWEVPERFLTQPLTDEAKWLRETGLAQP